MLCDICLDLIHKIDNLLAQHPSGPSPTIQILPHHEAIDTVIESVEVVQCVICIRLVDNAPGLIDRELNELMRSQGHEGVDYSPVQVDFGTWQRDGEMSLRFMAHSYGGISTFQLRTLSDPTVVASTRDQKPLSSCTGDDSVLDLARHWLEVCETTHENCRLYPSTASAYPTRLLDLNPDGYGDGLHFCLIEDQAIRNASGGYVTLSHRWGPPESHPPMLNSASHQSLLQGWPLHRLSKTYQDVIMVIKRLNVRYMWLDSLCIIQDDPLDMHIEAHKTASVYGNAICNISALEARQDGLFNERDAMTVSPLSRLVSRFDHTQLQKSYAIGDHLLWNVSVFDAPLSERAWVLQEQLLARRNLFFSDEQLLWSCISGAWCETYPMNSIIWQGSDFYLSQRRLEPVRSYCAAVNRALFLSPELSSTGEFDPMLERNFRKAWRYFLEEYAPRELTKPSDKLLAIAGIVSSFAATQDDECIAGHWKSSFPFNLLWHLAVIGPFREPHPDNLNDERNPIPIRRTPTWSWASQDKYLTIPGELDRKEYTPIARVLDIERSSRILASSDVEQEEVGVLVLISPQLPLVRIRTRDDISARWEFETSTASTPVPSVPDPFGGGDIETYFDIPEDDLSTTDSLIGAFVSCMVRVSQSRPADDGSKETLIRYEGLILRQSPPAQLHLIPEYARVGYFAFEEIVTGSSASRFVPADWRFHIDVEMRDDGLFTQPPDFNDTQLMHTVRII